MINLEVIGLRDAVLLGCWGCILNAGELLKISKEIDFFVFFAVVLGCRIYGRFTLVFKKSG